MNQSNINRNDKDGLNQITKGLMMQMSKKAVYRVAQFHGLTLDEEASKTELVEKINEILVEDFINDCKYLLPNEVFYLMSLFLKFQDDYPPYYNATFQSMLEENQYEMDDIHGYYLMEMGYFQTIQLDEQHSELKLYPAIMLTFLKEFPEMLDRAFENLKKVDYAIALSNIYGWYSYEQYRHVWNLYNDNKITEDFTEDFLEMMAIKSGMFWLENRTIVNDLISNDLYSDIKNTRAAIPWYTPTEDEIESYVDSFVGNNSKIYKKFKDYFNRNKGTLKTKQKLENFVLHILFEMKLDMPIASIFELMEEHHYVMKHGAIRKEFSKMYLDARTNIRKWSLKGLTTVECNLFISDDLRFF